MRKTGKPPITKSANFKVARKPLQGFTDPNSESTDPKAVAIIGAQSDITNDEATEQLVIPVKRNADWMKKTTATPVVAPEKFGLQVMASKPRDIQSSRRIGQAAPVVVEDDSDVDEETYERVPIESFGAAMLRGMGWKDEEEETKDTGVAKARPSLLGLGAKAREIEKKKK